MSGSNPWTWDPIRRAYYIYNQAEGLYVYENGARVDSTGRTVQSPNSASSSSSTRDSAVKLGLKGIHSAGDGLQDAMANLNIETNHNNLSSNDPYRQSIHSDFVATLPNLLQTTYSKDITDPTLAALNVHSRGRLRGTWREHEPLFPSYKVHKPGKKFFIKGRVIKVLWPELLSNVNTSVTVTADTKYGEGIATKIRWFVVIREDHRFCSCLPVVTYSGQGVAKAGVIKSHHAIIYTSKKEPTCETGEQPSRGELPMLPGIRCIPKRTSDKLDRMSRIDFARVYTVEHGVKAYDFGMIAKTHLDRLIQQWIRVLLQDGAQPVVTPPIKKDESEEEDEEDEYDGAEEEKEWEDDDDDDEHSEDFEDRSEERRGYRGKSRKRRISGRGTAKEIRSSARRAETSQIKTKTDSNNISFERLLDLNMNLESQTSEKKVFENQVLKHKLEQENMKKEEQGKKDSDEIILENSEPGLFRSTEWSTAQRFLANLDWLQLSFLQKKLKTATKLLKTIESKRYVEKSAEESQEPLQEEEEDEKEIPHHLGPDEKDPSFLPQGLFPSGFHFDKLWQSILPFGTYNNDTRSIVSSQFLKDSAIGTSLHSFGTSARKIPAFANSFNENLEYQGPPTIMSDELKDVEDEDSSDNEYEVIMEEDDESDNDTIDEPIPPHLCNLDLRVLNPIKWRSQLENLQQSILNRSTLARIIAEPLRSSQTTQQSIEIMDIALRNLAEFYHKHSMHVTQQVTEAERRPRIESFPNHVTILVATRPGVAEFKRIPVAQLSSLLSILKSGAEIMDSVSLFLDKIGLKNCAKKVQDSDSQIYSANLLSNLVDSAIVNYCFAHIGTLEQPISGSENLEEVRLSDTLIIRSRCFNCFGGFINNQHVVVFEEVESNISQRNSEPLFLSTSLEDLADTWGPIWEVRSREYESMSNGQLSRRKILRLNAGDGCIIPWKRQSNDPELLPGESLAHWTQERSDLDHETFFETSLTEPLKLLIGGRSLFYCNHQCAADENIHFQKFRSVNKLKTCGTKNSVVVFDHEYSIQIAPPFVSMAFVGKPRTIPGTTLKSAILGLWVNEPEGRNPAIVRNTFGLEISACTFNARRIRLARLLGSDIMKTYLEMISFQWPDEESKRLYFEALTDRNISAFEKLYLEKIKLQKVYGKAIGKCLQVLLETGEDFHQGIKGLWISPRGHTWLCHLSRDDQRWAGILKDTADSCCVAIVSNQCLEFRETQWQCRCQFRGKTRGSTRASVLETALIVNKDAYVPSFIQAQNGEWVIRTPKSEYQIDLGESGKLRFLFRFANRRRAVVFWNSPIPHALLAIGNMIPAIQRKNALFHRELVLNEDGETCEARPIPLYITSSSAFTLE